MHILALSGSLRSRSSNKAVLLAAARLAPARTSITLFEGLAGLPYFNPDLDSVGGTPPPTVATFRDQVDASDGLLISSPEYARGISGALKNALDWLVGSPDFPGKPVAVINASQRSVHADAHLRLTLETMSAALIQEASITLPLIGRALDADGIVTDPDLAAPLRAALACFAAAIDARTPGGTGLGSPLSD